MILKFATPNMDGTVSDFLVLIGMTRLPQAVNHSNQSAGRIPTTLLADASVALVFEYLKGVDNISKEFLL